MVRRVDSQAATGFVQEFKDFALKGNVLDLAVAVIIGGAFGKIVSSFVADIIMPLISPLLKALGDDWKKAAIGVGLFGDGIKIGNFLASVVDFVIVALVIFLAVRTLVKLKKQEETVVEPVTNRECPYCLDKVPLAATKCRSCTSELPPLV